MLTSCFSQACGYENGLWSDGPRAHRLCSVRNCQRSRLRSGLRGLHKRNKKHDPQQEEQSNYCLFGPRTHSSRIHIIPNTLRPPLHHCLFPTTHFLHPCPPTPSIPMLHSVHPSSICSIWFRSIFYAVCMRYMFVLPMHSSCRFTYLSFTSCLLCL